MKVPVHIGSISTTLPSSWEDVTIGQWADLVRHHNDLSAFRLLSIFSGVPYKTCINIDSDKFDPRVFDMLDFIRENPIDVHGLERLEQITIGERKVTPPSDPGKCTIGQKLTLQALCRMAQESNGSHAELVINALAVYLQPLIDGPGFDDEKVEATKITINNTLLVESYPWGSFFLTGYIEYLRWNSPASSQNPQPMRSEQGASAYSRSSMSGTLSSS
jgi:hypothetical protein